MHASRLTTLLCLALMVVLAMGQFDNWNCPALLARNISKSILELHPSDIKVMMAMGDSFTSAFGVTSSWNESRGYSFSIGGDAGAITLPNIFKVFNPSIVGTSLGAADAEVCYGETCPGIHFSPAIDGNNAAKSGATIYDMVSSQVNYLIREVNKKPDMDVSQDWKVLTIMIGANDLCASCAFNLTYLSADEYESNLMGTLERIRSSLPRTFVNLVPSFNISQAYDLSLKTSRCANVSRPLFVQCECIFKPSNSAVRELMDSQIAQFNQRAAKIATYYQRKAYDNFAVVVQPFPTNTRIDQLPSQFLSLDCFHLSKSAHEAMAIALWNAMLTPAANKHTTLNMTDAPLCPTATSLLYTY